MLQEAPETSRPSFETALSGLLWMRARIVGKVLGMKARKILKRSLERRASALRGRDRGG
jgi:hypothetical protein